VSSSYPHHRWPGSAPAHDPAGVLLEGRRDRRPHSETSMGSFSIWHWVIVLIIVLLIFGTKKLRNIGADLGGAVKGFKEGMKDDEDNKAKASVEIAAPGTTIEGEVKDKQKS